MVIMFFIPWVGMPLVFPLKMQLFKINLHPGVWRTKKNISIMKSQLQRLGLSIDWDKEISTCDENYYKQQQIIFSFFIKKV